jgi:excinuclease ABC subunit A
VVVIEHNLDVIRAADWIIDLGPEGGERGGELVCAGTPAEVTAVRASHTGRALKSYAARAGNGAGRKQAAAPAPQRAGARHTRRGGLHPSCARGTTATWISIRATPSR